ncbi:MAG: DUF935 domain-containing protein [Fimbriimonadaceae bacterium]|nr:DUF935 domain-containing protein [Fimbriimonadaceae bacterium]
MPLFQLKRKPKPSDTRELAPTWTLAQRTALEWMTGSPGSLPLSVYDAMQKDAMVQTALTVKRLAVLAADWKIVPSSDRARDRSVAEFVHETLVNMNGSAHSVMLAAMDSFAKGWSIQERVHEIRRGRLVLREVRPKNPSAFSMDQDEFGRLRALILRLPGLPERRLDPSRFVIHIHRKSYDRPNGVSDLDAAHRHWQAKTKLLAAWQTCLERFAVPTVLGSFERGMSQDEQGQMLSALQNLAQATALVYPSEMEISTLGGQKEPSSTFQEAIEFHNREIARAILGQTLTTDEGRRVGSLALGKVHLQVFLLQMEAIRRDLADGVMTEQVIRPLVAANFDVPAPPRFEFKSAPLDVFATGRIA